jgi:dienelactone hydrolase
LGYVAIATDMYGGGVYHADRQGAGESLGPLWSNPKLLRSRVVSWLECLKGRPEVDASRVAAIGYCFGGQCVLELARSGADIRAVVSYHGILKTHEPARLGEIKAQVAVYTGALDPYAPLTDVQSFRNEMVSAGARWQLTEFGNAYHAFTDYRLPQEPELGLAFDPVAEAVSWSGTVALLKGALS